MKTLKTKMMTTPYVPTFHRIRKLALLSFVLTAVLAVGACGTNSDSSATSEDKSDLIATNIGWQPAIGGPMYDALETNGFKNAGLDPSIKKFNAGPPIFAALESESLDVAMMSNTASVVLASQGTDAVTIAIEADGRESNALMVGPKSNITNIRDLKNKTIGNVRGSAGHLSLLKTLDKAGLTTEDVNIVDIQVPSIVPSMENGDIDAVYVWDPWVEKLADTVDATALVDDTDVDGLDLAVWVARKDWIDNNPEAVQRFLGALQASNEAYHKDPSAANKKISSVMAVSSDQAQAILERAKYPELPTQVDPNYEFSFAPSQQGAGLIAMYKEVSEFLVDTKTIKRPVDPTDVLDAKPLERFAKTQNR